MLIIDLKINLNHIYSIHVFRKEELKDRAKIHTYRIEGLSGKTVRHKYSDGVIKLAIKVLQAMEDEKI